MSGHKGTSHEISGKSLLIMTVVVLGLGLLIWLLLPAMKKEVNKLRGASDTGEVAQKPLDPTQEAMSQQQLPPKSAPPTDSTRHSKAIPPLERQKVEESPSSPMVSQKEIPAPALPPPSLPPKPVVEPEWVLLDSMEVRCPRELDKIGARANSFYRPLDKRIKSWEVKFPGLEVSPACAVFFMRYGNTINNGEIKAGTWLMVKVYKYHPKGKHFPELVLIASTKGGQ